MEIAIVGGTQSGKSTLFQIMTGVKSAVVFGEQAVVGIAKVPDKRFAQLVDIFKPRKATPATVPFVDVNAFGQEGWEALRPKIATADAFLHVVDCFSTDEVSEMVKRYKTLEDEFIISDLGIVEKKMERLAKLPQAALGPDEIIQQKIMPAIKSHLEGGRPLRELALSQPEADSLRGFAFWSQRPELVVLNVAEGSRDVADEFKKETALSSPVITICCLVELEIAELPEDERKGFLDSMGIETPAFETIIRESFSRLGRICYFTVGEDEVRAWVIKKGSSAPRAAAAIHKDFERGFIKAEVVSFDDFMHTGKSIASAKSSGKLRLEGKDYIVQDGDIISFRFAV